MTFYLLTSTHEKKETGDILIVKEKICAISYMKIIEDKKTFFQIVVNMDSNDDYRANFNTQQEAEKVINELCHPDVITDVCFQERDRDAERKEKMESMLQTMIR